MKTPNVRLELAEDGWKRMHTMAVAYREWIFFHMLLATCALWGATTDWSSSDTVNQIVWISCICLMTVSICFVLYASSMYIWARDKEKRYRALVNEEL